MSSQETKPKQITLDVRKIGGIDDTTVAFDPGITVLEGRNATNRTSLLQAIMAACGSDDVSIKGDAERAEVTLTTDEEPVTRTLTRENGTVVSDGEGLIEDPA